MSDRVAAVVPAAGQGRRFGGRKLVALVDGTPMIERVIRCLLDGGVDEVVVVVAPDSEVAAAGTKAVPALEDARVRLVINPDPDRGMLSSIQTGLNVVDAGWPVLILPGDMPFVQAATVSTLAQAARDATSLISPRHGGERGHPLVVPPNLRSTILDADPSTSLKELLEPFKTDRVVVDVDDGGVVRDVDTSADV